MGKKDHVNVTVAGTDTWDYPDGGPAEVGVGACREEAPEVTVRVSIAKVGKELSRSLEAAITIEAARQLRDALDAAIRHLGG